MLNTIFLVIYPSKMYSRISKSGYALSFALSFFKILYKFAVPFRIRINKKGILRR